MKSNMSHEELVELQLKQAKQKELITKVQAWALIGIVIWIAIAVLF